MDNKNLVVCLSNYFQLSVSSLRVLLYMCDMGAYANTDYPYAA